MIRRLTLAALVAAVAATSAPASAAPKVTTLYFANTGSCGTESPVYALLAQPQDGGECVGTFMGYQGNGILAEDVYTSTKSTKMRLDHTRKVTGTVHLQHFGALSLMPRLPGYATAEITVKLEGVKLGTSTCTGPIVPLDSLKCTISHSVPGSLKGRIASKLAVTVKMVDSVGLTGVSYTAPFASSISVPVK